MIQNEGVVPQSATEGANCDVICDKSTAKSIQGGTFTRSVSVMSTAVASISSEMTSSYIGCSMMGFYMY